MKQLFVIHNINTIKNEEHREIYDYCNKKEIENNFPTLKLSETPIDIVNSAPSTTTNSSAESRKYSLNFLSQDSTSFNFNSPTNSNTNNIKTNKFLGKKIKFHFNVIKKDSEIDKNDFLQSLDNTLNNESEKNDSFNLENSKNIIEINNITQKGKKYILNEGRWSNKEHIKFIEAIVDYGKNWKNVQKYVGTRSSAQARSHAQKFLLKLKMIKNSELNLDFTINNIKNLSDIIDETKRKKNNNEDERNYIINTLISLSETISIENNSTHKNSKNPKYSKNKKILIDEDKKDNRFLIKSNIKNYKKDLKEIKILEIEEEKNENKEINKKINEDKNCLNEDSANKDTKDILLGKNNISLIEEDSEWKNKDYSYNDSNHKKLVFEDGIAFYLDEGELLNYNIFLRTKEYYYYRNFEYTYYINKNFFS